MTTFWKLVKKFPYISIVLLLSFLIITARVQGNIATLTERTLVNFVSGIAVISIILYSILFITGSLNPGDKAIIDIKKIGEKLLKGDAEDH